MRQRRTPHRQSALRAMADPHISGGAALRRAHRALRHRRTDQWRKFPRLCRAGSRAHPRARRHRRYGQPRQPQGPRYSRRDPRGQSQALLPASLLARPQSNRAGFRQNEDLAAQGRRPNNRTDLANHRCVARLLHPDRMRKLLQKRRIRFSLTRSRFKAPFGHWKTQTFVAGLRCGALTAPWVIDAPIDRAIFETYVRTQLVPTLQEGDIVILDNLPAHKSPAAEQAIRERGAWLIFLPPYSPDLNPIEMAFAKLKAHLRAMAMRTIDELWKAIGQICDLFTPEECANYFEAAGYGLK